MTCIATDGLSMAGDGRVTSGSSLLADDFPKVRRLDDGAVAGMAGDLSDIVLAFDWLNRGAPFDVIPKFIGKPGQDDGFEALVLHRDGRLFWFDTACVMVPYSPPWTIGCGAEIALTCLHLGLSPAAAVERAMHLNVKVGGVITDLRPTAPPPPPRTRLWQRRR